MDVDGLLSIVRWTPALAALREQQLDRGDLQTRLDVSRPTVHRLTRALEDEGLVERVDGTLVLTALGESIADEAIGFERTVRTARRLAPVLEAVQDVPVAFDLADFADATVTRAEPGNPYRPVNRFMELVRETETLRGLDPASINPLHLDELHTAIVEGMETHAVYPPDVAAELLASNPERVREAAESQNLTIRTYADLPFGLTICDERVGVGIYDDDLGMLQYYLDTAAPGAREWAEAVYDQYWTEADRIDLERALAE